MSSIQRTKRSGYLFLASGGIFFCVALLGKQPVFYGLFGVGVAFIAIGASTLRKANRE